MALPEIRIGTSGWTYWHWKNVLYPAGLPRSAWLACYQARFNTLELNSSFYHMPRPSTFARWREASPQEFLWTVKANRQITHYTRLADRAPLDKFLAAAGAMGEALGVILFQLPPSLKFDAEGVARFLGWLPEGMRYAVEPRHKTWFDPAALGLLEQHRVALCIADSGGRFFSGEHATADFIYVRFHGGERLYASRYTLDQMRAWAGKLVAWGRPAFVYFNNDFHGYAVENALELKQAVGELQQARAQPAARRPSRRGAHR
jgi:uncharacterized protein YecE (DUF72 family)